MAKLEGSYTVMVTPFTEDGKRIDEKAARRFVDWQIAQGSHGLITLGSMGEYYLVTDEERRSIVAIRPVRESLEDLFMRAVTDPVTGGITAPGAVRGRRAAAEAAP